MFKVARTALGLEDGYMSAMWPYMDPDKRLVYHLGETTTTEDESLIFIFHTLEKATNWIKQQSGLDRWGVVLRVRAAGVENPRGAILPADFTKEEFRQFWHHNRLICAPKLVPAGTGWAKWVTPIEVVWAGTDVCV